MSYILDALRKSERERDPATPAPPGAVHNITISLPGRSGLVIVGTVLLLAMLGTAAFFWRSTVGRVSVPAATAAPAAPVTEPLPAAAAKSAASEVVTVSPPVEPATPPARVHDLAEQAKVPIAVVPRPKPAPKLVRKTASAVKPVKPAPVPAPMEASATGDSVPLLQQLPLEFQRALPPLTVTIHVYAPDPSQRILFINNREYHRGSRIADGVRVEEIVPDGVVLSYQGERFRINRPH